MRKAREFLQRNAPSLARRLQELTEDALRGGPKCPTCGRGTLRDERTKLQALVAALDRAGLTSKPTLGDGEEAGAALLVFPPGSRIGIVAAPPGDFPGGVGPEGPPAAERAPVVVDDGPARLVRADVVGRVERDGRGGPGGGL